MIVVEAEVKSEAVTASTVFISLACRIVGSVVEWLKRRTRNQHGLGSKPARAILLCPWERHLRQIPLLGGPGKQF